MVRNVTASAKAAKVKEAAAEKEAAAAASYNSKDGGDIAELYQIRLELGNNFLSGLPLPRSAFEGYFDRIVKITQGIQIADMSTYNGAFSMAKLQRVAGQIYLLSMRYVKTIAFDALVETTGIHVQCRDYSILESISFKMLKIVDGNFLVNGCHKLTHIALPKLTMAKNFAVQGFPLLKSLSLPKLATVTGTLEVRNPTR